MRIRLLAAFSVALGLTFSNPSLSPAVPGLPPAIPTHQPACTIADSELFGAQTIDESACGLDGSGDEAHVAQNRAKNNLCAGGFLTSAPQAPALATQLTFRRLQDAADQIRAEHGLGVQSLPDDRSIFAGDIHTTTEGDNLGEGALVRYVGFLLEGHFSDKEGVNCNRAGQQNYDIHLAFSNTKPSLTLSKAAGEALECRSVTAEIIPRRRPEAWGLLGSMRKNSSKGLRAAVEKINAHDLRRPLRITGQLFFDASHQACINGTRVGGNPGRASNWEIHPVYAIDVCDFTTAGSCRWDDDAVWTPLHEWLDEDQ